MSCSQKLDRRDWLRIGGCGLAAGALAAASSPFAQAAGIADHYNRLDSDRWLGEVEILATIEDEKVFTEGPAV
ncbi:MAG: hypothetical protein KDA59_01740, partial [Planctomycetales bacterium]|nr:hypothetical protein [Planctomycetales bacterium]